MWALRNTQRVDMIEDEEDEAHAAAYTAAFGLAEEALHEVRAAVVTRAAANNWGARRVSAQ